MFHGTIIYYHEQSYVVQFISSIILEIYKLIKLGITEHLNLLCNNSYNDRVIHSYHLSSKNDIQLFSIVISDQKLLNQIDRLRNRTIYVDILLHPIVQLLSVIDVPQNFCTVVLVSILQCYNFCNQGFIAVKCWSGMSNSFQQSHYIEGQLPRLIPSITKQLSIMFIRTTDQCLYITIVFTITIMIYIPLQYY